MACLFVASEASFPLSLEFLYLVRPSVRPSVRPCVRPSVRAFWVGFWAPLPTGFRDLGPPEGFNFGLSEARLGLVRLSRVQGRLLSCSQERFPSI